LSKQIKMAKVNKVGRPKVAKKDRVRRIPISAKVKHHPVIRKRFEEEVAEFERSLDKEVKQ